MCGGVQMHFISSDGEIGRSWVILSSGSIDGNVSTDLSYQLESPSNDEKSSDPQESWFQSCQCGYEGPS